MEHGLLTVFHVPCEKRSFGIAKASKTMEICRCKMLLQAVIAIVCIQLVAMLVQDNEDIQFDSSKYPLPRILKYDMFNVNMHPYAASSRQGHTTQKNPMKKCFDMTIFGKKMYVQCRSHVNNIFAENITVMVTSTDGGESNFDVAELLEGAIEGMVIGDLNSHVHGHLLDGTFEGVVTLDTQTIYVERADKFFAESNKPPFDSVAYRRADVELCETEDGDGSGLCQIDTRGVVQRLRRKQRKQDVGCYRWPRRQHRRPHPKQLRHRRIHPKWRPSATEGKSCHVKVVYQCCNVLVPSISRSSIIDICHLLQITVDHEYLRNVAMGKVHRAVIDVQLVMAEVDRIFRKQDFNNDGKPDMIGVKVAAIEVVHNPTGKGYHGKRYPFRGHYRPDESLRFYNDVESMDHSDVCLGGVFTYRNFGTTLGLAAIPKPFKNVVGGICFKDRTVYGSSNSFFVTAFDSKSQRPVPRALAVITTAHEIGHGFGASHDDDFSDKRCFPREPTQRFLMASWAPKVINMNTRTLSKCSRSHINVILRLRGHCLH